MHNYREDDAYVDLALEQQSVDKNASFELLDAVMDEPLSRSNQIAVVNHSSQAFLEAAHSVSPKNVLEVVEANRPRILLVEDDEFLLEFLATLFEEEGFEVWRANDGRAAWWMIRQERPDIVVCDYLMPHMSGGELLVKVRENERYSNVPFVLMSSRGASRQMVDALEQGADDFLVKPFVQDELIARVKRSLRKSNIESGLQGDLQDLALVDLIQMLVQNRRTGFLEVRYGLKSYNLFFETGHLLQIDAFPSKISGKKAFFRCLAEGKGDFRFRSGKGPDFPKVADDSLSALEFLLMDGIRSQDEILLLLESFPGSKTKVRRKKDSSWPLNLTELGMAVLNKLKKPSFWYDLPLLLDSLVSHLDLEILQTIRTLVKDDVLEWCSPKELQKKLQGSVSNFETLIEGDERSPLHLIGSPVYEVLLNGLIHQDMSIVISSIEGALQGGFPVEILFQRILGEALIELLRRDEAKELSVVIDVQRLHDILEQVLSRLRPLMIGKNRSKGLAVLAQPIGEHSAQSSLKVASTFFRAVGFNVIHLEHRVSDEKLFDVVASSGASFVCLMIQTEAGARTFSEIQKYFAEHQLAQFDFLIGGGFLNRSFDFNEEMSDNLLIAGDSLDLVRKSLQLLPVSVY